MKLTIAVKEPQEDTTHLEEQVSYRWNRIIGTIAGAAGLVAVVVFVFFPGGQNPDIAQPTPKPRTDLPLFKANSAQVSAPPKQDEADTELSADTPLATSVESSPQPTVSAAADRDEYSSTSQDRVTAPTSLPATSTEPDLSHASSHSAVATSPQTPEENASLFGTSNTTIHSDKIKRFALAKSVSDKEPVGKLADVTLGRDNVATVFAYSEALDLKDETLRYVWSLNGNTVADVKVSVWSARWRSYSSKYVTAQMRGDWKVELRDSSDDVLAMTEFQY